VLLIDSDVLLRSYLPFKKADLLNPKRDTHRRKLRRVNNSLVN